MRAQLLASLKPLDACDEDSRGGGDHDLNPDRVPDQNTKAAAVLVPIVAHDTGPTIVLTVRTQHLRSHAGQVSFPVDALMRKTPVPSRRPCAKLTKR